MAASKTPNPTVLTLLRLPKFFVSEGSPDLHLSGNRTWRPTINPYRPTYISPPNGARTDANPSFGDQTKSGQFAIDRGKMRGHVRNYQLKTGETRWAAVVYRGKQVAKNAKLQDAYRWIYGFLTQRAAQNELNKLLHSIDEGTYAEASKQTIAEFLARWLTTVKPKLEAKTFERYKKIVDCLHLGGVKPRL
jgi:hypothetical protein